MYFKLPDFLQCSNLDLLFPGPSSFLPPFVSLAYIYYRNKLHTVKMLHLSYRGTTVRMPLQWDYRGMDHRDGRSNHRGVLLLTALLIWPHSAASPPEPHLVMVPPKSWFLWWTSGPDLNSHEQNRKLIAWHRLLLWWSPVLTSWVVACAVLVPRIIRCHPAEYKSEEDPVSGEVSLSILSFLSRVWWLCQLMDFMGKEQKVTFQEEPWWNWSSHSKVLGGVGLGRTFPSELSRQDTGVGGNIWNFVRDI